MSVTGAVEVACSCQPALENLMNLMRSQWLTYSLRAESERTFSAMHESKIDNKRVIFLFSETILTKGYLPNLLESALCHQIFVF